MELHFKYLDAMQVADRKIEGEKHVRIPACLLPSVGLHSVWSLCTFSPPAGQTRAQVPPTLTRHLARCWNGADESLPVVLTALLIGAEVLSEEGCAALVPVRPGGQGDRTSAPDTSKVQGL